VLRNGSFTIDLSTRGSASLEDCTAEKRLEMRPTRYRKLAWRYMLGQSINVACVRAGPSRVLHIHPCSVVPRTETGDTSVNPPRCHAATTALPGISSKLLNTPAVEWLANSADNESLSFASAAKHEIVDCT